MHVTCSWIYIMSLAAWQPLGRETHGGLRTRVSPCSSPMRNLEEVMKTRWAEVMWVSSGVRTVRNPQADADRRRTFSPPILEDRKHIMKPQGRVKGQSPSGTTRVLFQFSLFSKNNLSAKPALLSQVFLTLWGVALTSSLSTPFSPGAASKQLATSTAHPTPAHASPRDTTTQRHSGGGDPQLGSLFCSS